ncbi:MAG: TerB family tellurite resistance protein [Myxococcales bacterium]|nr:TerB family tellurite resistance protein [Myxococcales bacterium]
MSMQDVLKKIQKDPKLKQAMDTLQLNEKSFRFLPIFPLIYVAWADGSFQEEEMEKILEIVEENGLMNADGAGILKVWLDRNHRPSDEFFVSGLRLVAAVLKHIRPEHKGNLLHLCEVVADSAGGLAGVGRVSGEERKAMGQIAELLGVGDEKALEKLLEKMRHELDPKELEWAPTQVSGKWVGINAVVASLITAGVFFGLSRWYADFVVSEGHNFVFLIGALILPQVGFFLGSMVTARLSAGNTAREGVLGTAAAIIAASLIGVFFLGATSKKYAGYNVVEPDPLLFPLCSATKVTGQRCIRMEDNKGKKICRLMKDHQADSKKERLGRRFRDWFPADDCKKDAQSKDLYQVSPRPERVLSKGYYPLCSETDDATQPCIRVGAVKERKNTYCRVMPNRTADLAKVGKGEKFKDWFPAPRYCRALYARVYKVWRKDGVQNQFVGYLPLCADVSGANQSCIHRTRIPRPGKTLGELVCLVSDSPTIPRRDITPAAAPYENWYPQDMCREAEGTAFMFVIFAFFGFAITAFFSSYFGGWVGERWQGTI